VEVLENLAVVAEVNAKLVKVLADLLAKASKI
jgi:hypothetical protein